MTKEVPCDELGGTPPQMTYEEKKRKRRMAFYSLERRELLILEAKIHAMKTISNECVDLLDRFLHTEHDDAKALEAFTQHVSLFKDAWQDYCDQKARVDEMVQLQQQVKQE